MVEPVKSLQAAVNHIDAEDLQILGTCAQDREGLPQLSWEQARQACRDRDTLVVFGTGFGLTPEALRSCEASISPIRGYGDEDYRHLSVRSAVSIVLDRLRGEW
jgi:hypothetical protein